jgi:hypothetical protein
MAMFLSARRVLQRNLGERRTVVVHQLDTFLPHGVQHPTIAEDILRLRGACAAADHELPWTAVLHLPEDREQGVALRHGRRVRLRRPGLVGLDRDQPAANQPLEIDMPECRVDGPADVLPVVGNGHQAHVTAAGAECGREPSTLMASR